MADEEVEKQEEETAAGAGEEETQAPTVPTVRYLTIQLKCLCICTRNDKIYQSFLFAPTGALYVTMRCY